MIEVSLTQGFVALIDDEDAPLVSQYQWRVDRRSRINYAKSGSESIYMHRLLLCPPPSFIVDHVDRDGLNNTRANLRLATLRQNAQNMLSRTGRSVFKGVYWFPKTQQWQAQIKPPHQKRHTIGYFGSPEEAARAYDQAARRHFGEFARVNFG